MSAFFSLMQYLLKARNVQSVSFVFKVLLNSPQFARKADQLAQQQQTQQVLVSKSIQDPVGVGGRNIITNVYLGGIGPGIVDYLPAPGNPDDEASVVTSAKM